MKIIVKPAPGRSRCINIIELTLGKADFDAEHDGEMTNGDEAAR